MSLNTLEMEDYLQRCREDEEMLARLEQAARNARADNEPIEHALRRARIMEIGAEMSGFEDLAHFRAHGI